MDPGRRRILAGGLGASLAGAADWGRGLLGRPPVDIADLEHGQLEGYLDELTMGAFD